MLYRFFFNYYFFILELVIKQALVIFLGEVETRIWSKLGLCHCSTLTPQTQGDAHCLALTNTSSNNNLSLELNLNNHNLGSGWRNTLQLLKTCVPKLNSLIISKSEKNHSCCKERPFHVPCFC